MNIYLSLVWLSCGHVSAIHLKYYQRIDTPLFSCLEKNPSAVTIQSVKVKLPTIQYQVMHHHYKNFIFSCKLLYKELNVSELPLLGH